jgi:hypothetical protein
MTTPTQSYQNAPSSIEGWNDCPELIINKQRTSTRQRSKRTRHISHIDHLENNKDQRDPVKQESTSAFKLPPSRSSSLPPSKPPCQS